MTDPAVNATLQNVLRLIVPEAMLIGVACILFVLSTLRAGKGVAAILTLAGLGAAATLHFFALPPGSLVATVTPAVTDSFGNFVRLAALITAIVLVLTGWTESGDEKAPDYYACLLVITAGLSLVGMANDLIFLFLALELISIPTYVMLYLPAKDDRRGQEAAIKYFLLSVLSSAFLLFGFSYLYGLTGTTNIKAILEIFPRVVAGDGGTMAVIAAVMSLAGLGFRITAFPFHFYAPDVYQGGPPGVVALLAFVPKVAGFAALLRLFGTIGLDTEAAPRFARSLMLVLLVLSAATMTVGNVMAILQYNVRRMLAYSSVAHAGYMLIGLVILPARSYRPEATANIVQGGEAILFYLVAYGAMTIGAFAVLACLHSRERPMETIDDLAGLRETHPVMALMMALFLFSLIGLPLTAGFVGKFLLFMGALAAPTNGPMQHLYQVLVLIAAINAAIAAFYYLRLVGVMYLRSSFRPREAVAVSPIMVAVVVCAIVTIWFGVYPWPLLEAARDASLALDLP